MIGRTGLRESGTMDRTGTNPEHEANGLASAFLWKMRHDTNA